MYTITSMSVSDFLNRKFLEWQLQENKRRTVEDFAKLFNASKSLMAMWMNGTRSPGPKFKKLIIALYGKEAIEAFGEDPALYYLKENWASFSPEKRRAILQQAEKPENETKRLHKRRRTSSS